MDGKGEFPPGKQGSGSHCHRVVAASCVGGRGQRTRPGGEVTGGAGDVKLTHQGNWNRGHIVIPIQNFGDVEVPSLSFFFYEDQQGHLGLFTGLSLLAHLGLVWLLR